MISRLKHFARTDIASLALAQGVALASSTLVTFGTALFLGPAGRGSLAFVVGLANIVGSLAFLSLHIGAVDAAKRGDSSAIRRTWNIALGISGGLLAVAVVLDLSAKGGSSLNQPPDVVLGLVGSSLVVVNLVTLRTVQGLGAADTFRNAWILQATLYTCLGLGLALVTRSYVAVTFGWFIAIAASTIYGRIKTPIVQRIPGARATTRSIMANSLGTHIGASGIQLLSRADIVILAAYVSRAELGVYSVAVPIAGMSWLFSEALSLATYSRARPSDTATSRRHRVRRMVVLNISFACIAGGLLVVLAWGILPILLPSYDKAWLLVAILTPGIIFQGTSRILFGELSSMHVPRAMTTIGVLSAVGCLAYIPLCAAYGATGAALASTILYIAQSLLVVAIFRVVVKQAEPSELPAT